MAKWRRRCEGVVERNISSIHRSFVTRHGDGLSDGRPEFLANGNEWRTAPLWGFGRRAEVTGYSTFLHDGRARNAEEAILWHGGEAESSKDEFRNLSPTRRKQLIKFIESL